MFDAAHGIVTAVVLLLSGYSLLKLALFALPYARRCAQAARSRLRFSADCSSARR